MKVTSTTLARLRLLSQRLIGAQNLSTQAPGDSSSSKTVDNPVELARWMLAMQGQDLPGVLLSLGLRMRKPALWAVRQAFDTGALVRSWPMRGTLHVCAPEDLGWILSLTGERIITSMTTRHRELSITSSDLAEARDIAIAATGSSGLSREELLARFSAQGQSVEGQRGIHLLGSLCMQGHLVQGPLRGNKQLFVASAEWIRSPRTLSREEALAEFVLRYFRSHGPATLSDFCWWTKLPLKDARLGLAAVRGELAVVESGGQEYFLNPVLLDAPVAGARSVLLLPGFDELLLGYADRSAALEAEYAPRIVPGNNGVFMPTIVHGGKVVGTWRKPPKASADVELLPFRELSPAVHRSAELAGERYRRFLER